MDMGSKIITAKVVGYCDKKGKPAQKSGGAILAQGVLCEHTDEKIGTFTFPVFKGINDLPAVNTTLKIRCYEVNESNVLGKHVKFPVVVG